MKKSVLASLIIPTLFQLNIHGADLKAIYKKLERGEYEDVISSLELSKSKDKKFLATKHYLIGLSHSRLQDFSEAITNYKKAISFGSQAKDIYYEVGQGLYALNELDQARKAFFRSAKLDYQRAQSYYYIAHISQLLDEHKNAKTYFSKILSEDNAKDDLKQIARFQLSESLLHMAREKDETTIYVKKYILPQLEVAHKMNTESRTGKDIFKRIKEIQKEFGLDPNLLVNGKRMPTKKINAAFSQSFTYDNNFTLSNDLPGNIQTKRDTFIFTTSASADYTKVLKRRYIITPAIDLETESHGDRENSDVYSSDSYTITPSVDIRFAHKLFAKPAESIFNLSYEYKAKDKDGIKEKSFNNRTIGIDIGEKFNYFKYGGTTVKLGFDQFKAYDTDLNFDKTALSIDQLAYINGKIYLLFFQTDKSDYYNAVENSTKSTILRFDFIYPELFPKININLALSQTWLAYDDETKDAQRGVETTTELITKFTKTVSKYVSADFEYTYSKNSSDLEDSSYTKHETSFQLNVNY